MKKIIHAKEEMPKTGYRELASQRDYLKVTVANMINRFGDSVDSIAFTWLVYAITGNAAWSAVIFGANQLPTILLMPFAGVLVERWNKKWLIGLFGMEAAILTDAVTYFLSAGILLLVSNRERGAEREKAVAGSFRYFCGFCVRFNDFHCLRRLKCGIIYRNGIDENEV